jgi:hypothetical protein
MDSTKLAKIFCWKNKFFQIFFKNYFHKILDKDLPPKSSLGVVVLSWTWCKGWWNWSWKGGTGHPLGGLCTLVHANDDGRLPIGSKGLSKCQCKDASPTFKLLIKMLLWSCHEFKVHAINVIHAFKLNYLPNLLLLCNCYD